MMPLMGCDFTSRPTIKKPIILAIGTSQNGRVQLLKLERLSSLNSFEAWLNQNPYWLGALDRRDAREAA